MDKHIQCNRFWNWTITQRIRKDNGVEFLAQYVPETDDIHISVRKLYKISGGNFFQIFMYLKWIVEGVWDTQCCCCRDWVAGMWWLRCCITGQVAADVSKDHSVFSFMVWWSKNCCMTLKTKAPRTLETSETVHLLSQHVSQDHMSQCHMSQHHSVTCHSTTCHSVTCHSTTCHSITYHSVTCHVLAD
jgi:hypothetical protein